MQPLTQVDISSELSGIVRTVAVEENQQVKKGDVLASLDTTKLEVQIERATASAKAAAAAVETAEVTLRESEQSLSRTSELTKRGMATQQALDTAQAARDRAKAALDSAEASLAIANADLKAQQTDLAKSTIYAPIDGIVLTRSVDPGALKAHARRDLSASRIAHRAFDFARVVIAKPLHTWARHALEDGRRFVFRSCR